MTRPMTRLPADDEPAERLDDLAALAVAEDQSASSTR